MEPNLEALKAIRFIKTVKQFLAFLAVCNLGALLALLRLHVEWDTTKIAIVVICMLGSFAFPLIYLFGPKDRPSGLNALFRTSCISVVLISWSVYKAVPVIKGFVQRSEVYIQQSSPNNTPPAPQQVPPSLQPPPPAPQPSPNPPPPPAITVITNPPASKPGPSTNPPVKVAVLPTRPKSTTPASTNTESAGPVLTVSPNVLDFGVISNDWIATNDLTVSNAGGGLLIGTANTEPPWRILSATNYNLPGGQSQKVTIVYEQDNAVATIAHPATASDPDVATNGFVILTGAGEAKVELRVTLPAAPTNLRAGEP